MFCFWVSLILGIVFKQLFHSVLLNSLSYYIFCTTKLDPLMQASKDPCQFIPVEKLVRANLWSRWSFIPIQLLLLFAYPSVYILLSKKKDIQNILRRHMYDSCPLSLYLKLPVFYWRWSTPLF